jgi:hypothetical protein
VYESRTIVAVGIILAPVVHRALHTFHWDADQADS